MKINATSLVKELDLVLSAEEAVDFYSLIKEGQEGSDTQFDLNLRFSGTILQELYNVLENTTERERYLTDAQNSMCEKILNALEGK